MEYEIEREKEDRPETPKRQTLKVSTPQRRSARKSVRPSRFEENISLKRIRESNYDQIDVPQQDVENIDVNYEPKWTSAAVGRVSQKRGKRGRKSKKLKNNTDSAEENENATEIVLQPQIDHKKDELSNIEESLQLCGAINDIQASGSAPQNYDKTDEHQNGAENIEGEHESKCPTSAEDTVPQKCAKRVRESKKQEELNTEEKENTVEIELQTLIDQRKELKDASFKNEESLNVVGEVNDIQAILNETFNTSDCILISPEYKQETNLEEQKAPLTTEHTEAPTTSKLVQQLTKNKFIVRATPSKIPSTSTFTESTSKQQLPFKRFLTPYKSYVATSLNNTDSSKKLPTAKTFNTIVENQAAVRPIRKRSLSVTVAGVQMSHKFKDQTKGVTFYSPANQTANIDDVDLLIAKSIKKDMSNENVTQRRKRSVSLDGAMHAVSKLPRPVAFNGTSSKIRQLGEKPVFTRRQMPNFAAIHQRNFNNMENLVEHATRKAERAQALMNSSTKKLTPSSTKRIIKNVANSGTKPKALRKIELSNTTTEENSKKVDNLLKILPNPRMAIIKPEVKIFTAPPVAAMNVKNMVKPKFNMSTSLLPKPIPETRDVVGLRQQRHRDMFKGRTASRAATTQNHSQIIKGVRSNRRFDLQMQHRKNLENK